ncbi:MAG: YtxH domain-containing protein [Chitinophagaceae bacterium]
MNKVLIALLAGVAVGMLVAPDKGTATRQKLIDGFNDLADDWSELKSKFEEAKDEAIDELAPQPTRMSSQI